MRFILRLSAAVISLSYILVALGCAHALPTRTPTEMLLTTDKGTGQLFKDLNTKLAEHKYKVAHQDESAGLLVMSPRGFSFDSEGRKVVARQTVQMRQEGGSLKVRIVYDCNYAGDRRTFAPCLLDDQEAINKISRVETGFMSMIRPLLLTHSDITNGSVEPVTQPAPTPAVAVKPATPTPAASSSGSGFDDWGADAAAPAAAAPTSATTATRAPASVPPATKPMPPPANVPKPAATPSSTSGFDDWGADGKQ